MHHIVMRADSAEEVSAADGHYGYVRDPLIRRSDGAVHMSLTSCSLGREARGTTHAHSVNESFYVLGGSPVIEVAGTRHALSAGSAGRIPPGVPHHWLNDGQDPARWIEMAAPALRDVEPADTFFNDGADGLPKSSDDSVYIARDVPAQAPRSLSMGASVAATSGLSISMLIEQPAALHTMFIVTFEAGTKLGVHDHPLEESYLILEGSCDFLLEGRRLTLSAGDMAWTSVGARHGMENLTDSPCRWLETQAPAPPDLYSIRFDADWSGR